MPIAALIQSLVGSSVGDAFQKIVGSFKADPTTALQVQAQLSEQKEALVGQLIEQITAQIDLDKVEASNANIFVAGWRPFVGWVCGVGLCVQFLVGPIATWIASLAKHPLAFPSLDMGTLMTLLLGMLGLSGMRTIEKLSAAPGADKHQ